MGTRLSRTHEPWTHDLLRGEGPTPSACLVKCLVILRHCHRQYLLLGVDHPTRLSSPHPPSYSLPNISYSLPNISRIPPFFALPSTRPIQGTLLRQTPRCGNHIAVLPLAKKTRPSVAPSTTPCLSMRHQSFHFFPPSEVQAHHASPSTPWGRIFVADVSRRRQSITK